MERASGLRRGTIAYRHRIDAAIPEAHELATSPSALVATLRDEKRVADALVHVAEQAGESIALPELLDRLCRLCVQVVPSHRSTVFLWSRRRHTFVPMADHGTPAAISERVASRVQRPGAIIHEGTFGAGQIVLLSRDRTLSDAERALLDDVDLYALAMAPLRARDRSLGALTVGLERAPGFSESSLAVLRGVARQASSLIDHARLFRREEEAAKLRARMAALGAALSTVEDPIELGRLLCTEGAPLFGVNVGVLLLREGDWLVVRGTSAPAATSEGLRVPLYDQNLEVVRAFLRGEPFLDNCILDPAPSHQMLARRFGLRSALSIPLVGRIGAFGCLVFGDDRRPYRFSAETLEEARVFGTMASSTLERAKLFEERSRSEEHFRSIIELGSDVISILDDAAIVRYESPSIERVLGYTPEELVGRAALELIHPDDLPAVGEALAGVIADPGVTGRVEFRFRHKNGSWRVMEGIGKASPDIGVIVTSRDVTERTQAEDSLRSAGTVASALARVGERLLPSLDAQVLLDRLCRVTTEVLGCAHSTTWLWRDAEQSMVPTAGHVDPPEVWQSLRSLHIPRDAMAAALARLEQGELVELRATDPGLLGHVLRHYETPVVLLMPLRTADRFLGAQTAACASADAIFTPEQRRIARGIAQLASTALANAQLLGELERVNRLKSEFVSTMSHELRTPLNVILGFMEIVRDPDVGEADRSHMYDRIVVAGRELMELIEATLSVGKLEAGRDDACFEAVSLPALWNELRETCGKSGGSAATVLEWSSPVPAVSLRTDAGKFKVIVRNLVRNGLKFTERGSVRVDVALDGDGCVIRVADTGIGIRPEDQATIFEMFQQADGSDRRRYGGTGLGLYIVRRFVTQLGGTIALESAPGRGSTFTVRIPLSPSTLDYASR